MFQTPVANQRFFVPEVVQTSAMDCGPAALKAILEGFGISVSYGRLREACQTDVDGTSINTIEDIALQLGLQAEQVMVPAEHIIIPEAQNLPAIVIVRLPSGLTHFLVVWNQVGSFLQVMDPATGRRWPSWEKFQEEILIHTFPVPTQDWRDWAGTNGFRDPLKHRLQALQIPDELINTLVDNASSDISWRYLAALDAATRMTASLVKAKGISAGEEAGKILQQFYELNRDIGPFSENLDKDPGIGIPIPYWSVIPADGGVDETGRPDPQQLFLRGAVLVRILGVIERIKDEQKEAPPDTVDLTEEETKKLPPDLDAALKEPSYRPEREIIKALREDGLLTPAILSLSLFAASLIVIIEALLFQGIIRIGQVFTTPAQRIAAVIILLAFVTVPLILEYPISASILRMGRRLEARLRIAFLQKLPRLGDRYFHSRLTSDMSQRAYDLRSLRQIPSVGFTLLRTAFQLLLTTIGVIWLDPISAPLAIIGTVFFVGLSFFTRPLLEERDLRLRTHIGALSRFYLDGLLGLVPVKTHSAERAMRRQHESQMVEWVRSGRDFYTWATYLQSIGILLYSAFAVLIVMNYISKGGQSNEILLLFYWTLSLPTLGQSLADQVQQYPMLRNRLLRLLEPLGAPDEEEIWFSSNGKSQQMRSKHEFKRPVSIEMQNVDVQVGGHIILKDISLSIESGEHLAIVGASGAGKSSLIGLLLGWHRPAAGKIYIDGEILNGTRIQSLRTETAWVDPAIQLWNRSFYDNLRYGQEHIEALPIGEIIQEAELFQVLDRLPDGLKTSLGEGGGLVSGGEGQRVRLGRAMLRQDMRLVLLDEPFRGLDREARRRLLLKAREYWYASTLICITHDVGETLGFPRVLVMQDGKIIEDGSPQTLAEVESSRYRSLLVAEDSVRKGLWDSTEWKRWTIDGGAIQKEPDSGKR